MSAPTASPARLPTTALAVLLLACGSAVAAPVQQPIEFAIWHAPEADLKPLGEVIRAAQGTCPGLVVNLRHYRPEEAYSRLQDWAARGTASWPDVVIIRDLWLPQFAGCLQPINTLVRATDLRSLPGSVRSRLKLGEVLYGVPWAVEARVLYVRPDLLATAGVLAPRTWAQVLAAARRCHRPPEVYGFGMPGVAESGAAEVLLQMLWAHGTDVPPVGDPDLLSPEALERSLGLLSDLHTASQPEVLSWSQPMLQEFFLRGRLAMLIAPAGFRASLPDGSAGDAAEGARLAWDALPLPAADREAGFIGLDMVCVTRRATRLAACGALLRALSSPAGVATLTTLGGQPLSLQAPQPTHPDLVWSAARADLESARGLPVPRWESAAPALSEGIFGLLTGRQTVPEAAATIRTRLDKGEPLPVGRPVGDREGQGRG